MAGAVIFMVQNGGYNKPSQLQKLAYPGPPARAGSLNASNALLSIVQQSQAYGLAARTVGYGRGSSHPCDNSSIEVTQVSRLRKAAARIHAMPSGGVLYVPFSPSISQHIVNYSPCTSRVVDTKPLF